MSTDQTPNLRAFSFHFWKLENIDCFSMDGFCDHRKLVFEVWDVAITSVPGQVIERGIRKRHIYDLRDEYIKEKDTI